MPRLARLAGGRAGRAADALAGEARRGSPERHRGADEGSSCLQGSPGETSDGGRGRGDCGIGGGYGNGPSGGRDDGGGVVDPEGLCGSRDHECLQGFLVAAAWRAATPPRYQWRRRRVLDFVLAPERVAALAPAQPPKALAPALLEASSDNIEVTGGETEMTVWRGEGVEMCESGENPRELRDLKAREARKAEPV
jgi:hypothetical protein